MPRLPLLVISLMLMLQLVEAQVTWSKDIAPIIYNQCASCHRPGGIGPFSLTTYSNAVTFASSIKRATESGHMPPWPPDIHYSKFKGQRSLTEEQKHLIVDWVEMGTLRGNPSEDPDLPIFNDVAELPGTPDMILEIPEFRVDSTKDLYQVFVLPNTSDVDRFIRAIEIIPGNRSIVHHVLVYEDTTGEARQLDAQFPGPGYISFGGVGVNSANLVGAWVPGSRPFQYPSTMGIPLRKKSDLLVQVHYPAGSQGKLDKTQLRIFFHGHKNVRRVYLSPILNHSISLVNGPLIIPANTIKEFRAEQRLPNFTKLSLISVGPHMHLIGTKIKSYALTPNNDTIKLINIPKWDFHWQGSYTFQKPVIIEGGSKLVAEATYDNTNGNVHNPNFPPKLVRLGESTTDEMMLVYFGFLFYEPGDEHIILDSSLIQTHIEVLDDGLIEIYPNPTIGDVNIKLDPAFGDATIQLYSMSGNLVLSKKVYQSTFQLPCDVFDRGVYMLEVVGKSGVVRKKIELL